MKRRILSVLFAVLAPVVAIGGAALIQATPALAVSGNQWCDVAALAPAMNAWGGGPEVASYSQCNGTANNYFFTQASPSGGGLVNVISGSGNAYSGYCIGDHGNSSSDARATLIGADCAFAVPWGGNFEVVSPCPNETGGDALYNTHWQAYLGVSDTNGSQMYLNQSYNATYDCFILYN